MKYRLANSGDISQMEDLILTECLNEWNHLPEDEIREHLRDIERGKTEAVLAIECIDAQANDASGVQAHAFSLCIKL